MKKKTLCAVLPVLRWRRRHGLEEPASEVNLSAIDETGVHAQESNRCPL